MSVVLCTTELCAWALAAMLKLEPRAPERLLESYPETASAMAEAADRDPLFSGVSGKKQTVALLVAIADHESSFRQRVEGDHGKSLGLFQIQPPTANRDAEELFSPTISSRVAIELVRQSMRICRDRPLEERLSWYAGGGPTCPDHPRALVASRQMFSLAKRVLALNGNGDTMKSVRLAPSSSPRTRDALIRIEKNTR